MLWQLLIKDLRRARRNPWPYLINLALPLCITALIGLTFGPSSKDAVLGQITVAVVDDDDSVLSSLLRGAMNQGDFKKHLEARFLERKEAFKQIHDNKISAVPFKLGTVSFFYNKALFAKAGVDATAIKTWDDYLAAVKKIKAAGIVPIAGGGGEKWPIHFYWSYLVMRDGGQ